MFLLAGLNYIVRFPQLTALSLTQNREYPV